MALANRAAGPAPLPGRGRPARPRPRRPCGLNGDGLVQQSCAGGQWADTTTCIDTDVCVDAAVEVVGTEPWALSFAE